MEINKGEQIPEFKKYPTIGRKYQHYKGGQYEVILLAKHSETNEDLVIYKSLLFGSFYARPLSMWFDLVKNHRKETVPRFDSI